MTSHGLLRVCLRRWYVVTLGLVGSVMLVSLLVRPNTVYWARVTATVVSASLAVSSVNELEQLAPSNRPLEALSMASLLAVRVNGGIPERRSSSPDATLYGEGYDQAVSARVRNTGGQWTNRTSEPVIDVEVVDLTPEKVQSTMIAQTSLLTAQLSGLQVDLRVPRSQRMTLKFSPTSVHVEAITSSRTRAWVAANAFGLGVTLSFTYFLDRALSRRGHKKAAS